MMSVTGAAWPGDTTVRSVIVQVRLGTAAGLTSGTRSPAIAVDVGKPEGVRVVSGAAGAATGAVVPTWLREISAVMVVVWPAGPSSVNVPVSRNTRPEA